jgi:hypothetical protein
MSLFKIDEFGKERGAQGSALSVNTNHVFADNTTRDTYFNSHATELKVDVLISVGTGYQEWNGTTWINKLAVLKGTKGDKGDKGDKGTDGNSVSIKDEGTLVEANINEIDFIGTGVTTSKTATGKVQVNITGSSNGSTGANINDTTPSTTTTYSSTKIESIKTDLTNNMIIQNLYLKSSNGTTYKILIADDGSISTTLYNGSTATFAVVGSAIVGTSQTT